jgi:hypothetical protein
VVEKLDDILTRLGGAADSQDAKPCLLPDGHPNRDFFVADMLDWAVKDDRASMEHPMFSLARKPDRRIRRYSTLRQRRKWRAPILFGNWRSHREGRRLRESETTAQRNSLDCFPMVADLGGCRLYTYWTIWRGGASIVARRRWAFKPEELTQVQ